jgi:hypothetical protein
MEKGWIMTKFVIQTKYKGYRFRSRTEARWAVFFDTLGLDWKYEFEGFDLGKYGFYLPDFWLPDVKMWAEVKAEQFTEEEFDKASKLVEITGFSCLLLVGVPENKAYPAITPRRFFFDGIDETILFCFTNTHNYPKEEHRFYSSPFCEGGKCKHEFGECDGKYPDTEYAVIASRSARFEHGENGNGTKN